MYITIKNTPFVRHIVNTIQRKRGLAILFGNRYEVLVYDVDDHELMLDDSQAADMPVSLGEFINTITSHSL